MAEPSYSDDLPFDMCRAGGATVDDLDLDFVRNQYLPNAIAGDVLERNERSVEHHLRSLSLMHAGTPTWGAILALGGDPQALVPGAYVQFLRVLGTEIMDPIGSQKQLTGRIDDVVRRLGELLDLCVSVRTLVAGSMRERRRPDYPVDALWQLAHNAVMHRSYEGTNTPVRVYWYADRVEITSPGGLYGRVTPETFGTGDTDFRNPLLAEVMHHLGFAQRLGLGVPLARKSLASNGNPPPEFLFEPTLVGVTVRAAP